MEIFDKINSNSWKIIKVKRSLSQSKTQHKVLKIFHEFVVAHQYFSVDFRKLNQWFILLH